MKKLCVVAMMTIALGCTAAFARDRAVKHPDLGRDEARVQFIFREDRPGYGEEYFVWLRVYRPPHLQRPQYIQVESSGSSTRSIRTGDEVFIEVPVMSFCESPLVRKVTLKAFTLGADCLNCPENMEWTLTRENIFVGCDPWIVPE